MCPRSSVCWSGGWLTQQECITAIYWQAVTSSVVASYCGFRSQLFFSYYFTSESVGETSCSRVHFGTFTCTYVRWAGDDVWNLKSIMITLGPFFFARLILLFWSLWWKCQRVIYFITVNFFWFVLSLGWLRLWSRCIYD